MRPCNWITQCRHAHNLKQCCCFYHFPNRMIFAVRERRASEMHRQECGGGSSLSSLSTHYYEICFKFTLGSTKHTERLIHKHPRSNIHQNTTLHSMNSTLQRFKIRKQISNCFIFIFLFHLIRIN